MTRQSKSEKRKIIAREFTLMHLDGKKGPTPAGGAFRSSWVKPLHGTRAKGRVKSFNDSKTGAKATSAGRGKDVATDPAFKPNPKNRSKLIGKGSR